MNALVGWWSIPSFFFYGWRATYHNWRSIWAPPARPHVWGAISAAEFAAGIRDAREQAIRDADERWLKEDSPFRELNETQVALVLHATDLYELLGVESDAELATIRRAYRMRCKDAHPDLSQETASDSTEVMIRLNQAWEVLRSPAMRRAYDWLELQRDKAAA